MLDKLPPEFQRIAELVDQEPPQVREVFHFMLAVAMEESGLSELINTAQVDGRTWYSCESAADDVFGVVRPEMDAELLNDALSRHAGALKCERAAPQARDRRTDLGLAPLCTHGTTECVLREGT